MRDNIDKILSRILITFLLFTLATQLVSAVEIKKIENPQQLSERFSSLARAGDYLISNGKYLILVAVEPRDFTAIRYYPAPEATGAILAFSPAESGLTNELIAGPVQIRTGFDYYFPAYRIIKAPSSSGREPVSFELQALFAGRFQEKGGVRTTYTFIPGKGQVSIKTVFLNNGDKEINNLTISVYFNALHSYQFNPYHQKYFPELNFRVYQKKGIYLGWVNLGSKPAELPKSLKPGQSVELNYALLVRKKADELLDSIYSLLKKDAVRAEIILKNSPDKTPEIVVEEALSSVAFFRSFVKSDEPVPILLPEGTYRLRANFFPSKAEKMVKVSKAGNNRFELEKPEEGTLKIRLVDRKGKIIPGKVSFFGLEGTMTPYFEPENPIQSGRSWERFKNSVYAVKQPLEVKLASGRYLLSASYGPLYTNERQVLEVFKDQTQEITFRLDKVINLKGYISIDPHLHTINSDGTQSVADRVKSIVAENLDVTIATDHNFVTDYLPALEELGLIDYLRVFSGSEVTPLNNYLHFNNYVLTIKSEEKTNGSIITRFEKVKDLFEACQKKNPGSLLQLNHPRSGNLGYFNNIGLDQDKASYASGDLELGFDLVEVMNGAGFHRGNDQAVADWLHLLNKGHFFPAVGSSDSHQADGGEPGYSRVYVRCSNKLKDLTWEDISSPLKKGQSFVSNGPVIEFHVNRKYQPGDLLTDKDGKVKIRVRVFSVPWVDVSEIRIIVNGERKFTSPVNSPGVKVKKFDKTFDLELKGDAFIVAEVLGQKSLYPVIQQPANSGEKEEAALPYALTNPVFVDVDGNKEFDPPWPKEIKIK